MEIYFSEHNGKMVVVLLDDEMKIVKPVYDFLRFQQQKGRAINTLKAYGTDLCLFWTFLKENGYAYDQVTPRLIADFIDYLRGGDKILSLYKESIRSNRTINRILSTVHSFYQYQADMHEIDNPILMHEINRPFNMFKGILAHTRSDNKIKQSVCVPNHQVPVWLQENGVSRLEEERESAVCHVRLCEFILPGDCRPQTFHNLI